MNNKYLEGSVSTSPEDILPLQLDSKDSIKRVLRQAIIAELDAANLYEQIAESLPAGYENLSKQLLSVADEELVHVGEFMEAIDQIDSSEENLQDKGKEEVREEFS